MPTQVHQEKDFLAGLIARGKLQVPVLANDPATPVDGWIWVADGSLKFRDGGVTKVLGLAAALDAEQVQDIVGGMFPDTATVDFAYNDTTGAVTVTVLDSPSVGGRSSAYLLDTDNHTDGTVNHVFTATDDTKLAGIANGATANATDSALRDRSTHTGTQLAATISDFDTAVQSVPSLDADTLGGSTAAQIQSAVTAAIVDTAPATLDTLNELAAALGDDPNFATTVTTGLAARSRFFAQAIPATAVVAGVADAVITHNLNTTLVQVQVVNTVTGWHEEFAVQNTSANTVTIRSEAGAIPAATYAVTITTAA